MSHKPDHIMYTGGGFSGAVEHFGHMNALIDSNIITRTTKFYGNSVGALFAIVTFLYANKRIKRRRLQWILEQFVKSMDTCKLTDTTELVFTNLHTIKRFCYRDLYLDACDKVIIGVTTRNGFKWVSNYKSNYHLFQSLIYSSSLSCMSTFSNKYLDGWYAYNAFRDLPTNTLISRTTYYPPHCLIPFTDQRIVTFLYNKGYFNGSREIQRYKKDGMEQLIDSQNINYQLLFSLHDKLAIINPEWKKELKRMFYDNIGR
jgi:hypothetical protein